MQQLCFSGGGEERSCTSAEILERIQASDRRLAAVNLDQLDVTLSNVFVDSDRYMYVDGRLHVI